MAENVRDRVIAIIAEQAFLEPADVTLEKTLEDLVRSIQTKVIH